MTGSYYIALSGLNAQQTGLDTVSQNVANASTPGYETEQVNLASIVTPGSATGGGVTVASVSLVSSNFLNTVLNSTTSTNNQVVALNQVLQSAQSYLNEPSSSGLSAQISNLYSAFDAMGNNPTQLAARQQVVQDAQGIATTFNQLSQNYNSLYNNGVAQVQATVSTVNTELNQLAKLNASIQQAGPAGSNTMVDQQNQIITSLSKQLGVTVQPQSDGSMNVLLGGVMLLQGQQVSSLSVQAPTAPPMPAGNGVSIVVNPGGATAPVTGGTIGGLMQSLNVNLPQYSSSFDASATALATSVNAALGSGSSYPGNGSTAVGGTPMFTYGGNGAASALNLQVSSAVVADPYTIAAAGTPPSGNLDGSNAQALANTATSPTGPNAIWQGAVGQIGLDTSNSNANVTSTNSAYQSAYQNQQAVSGVNINQQMTNMLSFQQGYTAATKVISTIETALNALMSAVQ